jgi:hypothetical protein
MANTTTLFHLIHVFAYWWSVKVHFMAIEISTLMTYAGCVYWTSLRNIYQQCLRLSYCKVDLKTATIARSPSFGPAPFL